MSQPQGLISLVEGRVKKHMSKYDASHDFTHIKRVVGLANQIHSELSIPSNDENFPQPKLDLKLITLSALLHDVGDRKYLQEGEDGTKSIHNLLIQCGVDEAFANKVQIICSAISYTAEIGDPKAVLAHIREYPELAVVQDADRLDTLGAIGVGRVFTYAGAKTTRGLGDSLEIFDQRLFVLESMMKTEPGRRMAKQRTEIMRNFKRIWEEELEMERLGEMVLAESAQISN